MIYQPTYFPTVETFQYLVKDENPLWEVHDFYEKQTYRTRCSLYAANGKLDLIVPIQHKKGIRQYTQEVFLENDFNWKKNHLKSWQNAYRSSPYFEFYEDEILAFYQKEHTHLGAFLKESIHLIYQLLDLPFTFKTTHEYKVDYTEDRDKRNWAKAKEALLPKLVPYPQVFQEKNGFIPNLSVLDLVFNEGPAALDYLKTS
jgi:tagatose-1,6-bisphosphate aldolase non-catalytic subunit AgaZ/GatZ